MKIFGSLAWIYPIELNQGLTLELVIIIKYLLLKDRTIVKPYTVINESLFKMNEGEIKGNIINLMIKYYENGSFTPNLRKLEIGI